jgi:hypothetical protein
MAKLDADTLQAALIGYQHEHDQIATKMAELLRQIGAKSAVSAVANAPKERKLVMSAAARKRIAAAQKRRWAAYRKEHGKSKGHLSPEGRQRISEAAEKRWAEAKKSSTA